MAFALYYKSRKIGFYLDRKLIKKIFLIFLSALILASILLIAQKEFFYLLVFNKLNAIYLFTLISVSSFIYFTILWLLYILKK